MRDAVLGVPFLLFPCLGLLVEEEVVFILDRVAHERLPAPIEEAEFLEEMALERGEVRIVCGARRHAEQFVGGDAEKSAMSRTSRSRAGRVPFSMRLRTLWCRWTASASVPCAMSRSTRRS